MLTVTASMLHEKLQVGEDEIVLNGPPSDLRGQMFVTNSNNEPIKVRALPLVHDKRMSGLQPGLQQGLHLSFKLQPGEQKMQDIWHQVNPQTAPGTYTSTIQVGGVNKQVKMIVQAVMEISLNPSDILWQGVEPGKTYTAEISLSNLGNVDFKVPDVKHTTTLDMDFLCRAISIAIRDKGADGYMPMMDELTKNIHKDMVGWATVSLKESGTIVAPGKTMLLHLSLTAPKDVDTKRDYMGLIRIWNKEISYSIKS
jgi:hypothetical protein